MDLSRMEMSASEQDKAGDVMRRRREKRINHLVCMANVYKRGRFSGFDCVQFKFKK